MINGTSPARVDRNGAVRPLYFLILTFTLAGATFAARMLWPAQMVIDLGYVLIVLGGLAAPGQRYHTASAILCGLLGVHEPVFVRETGGLASVLAGRALLLVTIWAAWAVVSSWKREKTLRSRAEELFQASFDHAASGAAMSDINGRFIRVNDAFCRFTGYEPEELLNLQWPDITHPDDFDKTRECLAGLMCGRSRSFSIEKRYRHKNGETIWAYETLGLIRDQDGQPMHNSSCLMDITAKKKADEELRAREGWFRDTFHHAGIGMVIGDMEGNWTHLNPVICRMLGSTEEELLQRHWREFTLDEDVAACEEGMRRLLAGELDAFQLEKRYIHRDGHPIWAHVTLSLIRDADGQPQNVTAQIVDITDRRRAEEALDQERGLSDRIVDTQPNLVFVRDLRNGCLVFVNPRVEAILGRFAAELYDMGSDISSIVHPDDADIVKGLLRAVAESEDGEISQAEYRLKHADGTWHWLAERAAVLSRDQQGRPRYSIGTAEDVTESRRMQAALRASEETLRRSHEELRDLTGRLLSAAEEERSRLARELHDDLNQRLAVLALELGDIQQRVATESDSIVAPLRQVQDEIGKLSDSVRSLAYSLHPSVLDYLGLVPALDSECAQFAEREGIEVNFDAVDVPESLPKDLSLCLYRIAQEALRNVARHASAPRAEVTLTASPGRIVLRITDHGSGFDADSPHWKSGLGITGMREHARLVGGDLTVESKPGAGTRVEAWVPPIGEVVDV